MENSTETKKYLPLVIAAGIVIAIIVTIAVMASQCNKETGFNKDSILGYWGTSPIAMPTTAQYYFDADETFTYYSAIDKVIQKGRWKIKDKNEITLVIYKEGEYAQGEEKNLQDVFPTRGRTLTVTNFKIKEDGECSVRLDGAKFYNIANKTVE